MIFSLLPVKDVSVLSMDRANREFGECDINYCCPLRIFEKAERSGLAPANGTSPKSLFLVATKT